MARSHVAFSLALASALVLWFSAQASAVIIQGGNGAADTTAPSGFPYWNAIGRIGSGTAIYLGNGYGITAHHVRAGDPTTVSFGGTSYSIDAGSWTWIADSNYADISMFRLSGSLPAITPVPISSIPATPISSDAAIYAIGYGDNRKADPNTWYLIGTGAKTKWLSVKDPNYPGYPYTTVQGYGWDASARTERWGTNTVVIDSYYDESIFHGQTTYTHLFLSQFDSGGPYEECALADGDSGGAAFIYEDGVWKLVGMNLTVFTPYYSHPAGVSAYGDYGGFADLSYYRGFLLPEPATLSVLGISGAGLLLRRRWRRP